MPEVTGIYANDVLMMYRVATDRNGIAQCVCDVCGYSEVVHDYGPDEWGHTLQDCMEELAAQIGR